MEEPRVKASLWVSAQIRTCGLQALPAVVRRRGDPDAGSILIRLDRLNGQSVVLSQSRDAQGRQVWMGSNDAEPMPDADVEKSSVELLIEILIQLVVMFFLISQGKNY